jgi:hypothetical protein
MDTYKLDLTPQDIGELVQILRIKRFQKNIEAFGQIFGHTEKYIEDIEDGKSQHGLSLLKKIKAKYPKFIDLKLEVSVAK